MNCDCCATEKKILKISYSQTKPDIKNKILESFFKKTCKSDKNEKLSTNTNKLIIYLEFTYSNLISIICESNFKKMKVYFIELNKFKENEKEIYNFDLKESNEFGIKKTTRKILLVFEDGCDVFYLQIRGTEGGISQPIKAQYQVLGRKVDENGPRENINYFIKH